MHKQNVNTESSKSNTATAKNRQLPRKLSHSGKMPSSPNQIDQIRQQVQEIETRACDVEVLLETIFEKIDGLASVGPVKTLDAINTLTTCALRNVALIKEHYEHINALTCTEGGVQ